MNLPSSASGKWKQAQVPLNSTIRDVVHNLELVAIKICLVVDAQGYFVGTISDGDVRRALLDGLGFESAIEKIVQKKAVVVSPGVGREAILQLMVNKGVQQIPVINDDGKVVGLHLWSEASVNLPLPNFMVIMAGGLGTRLQPHTRTCPKPLLPVAGKPLLEHIIEHARKEGFVRFLIAINYLGDMIESYFGNGERWKVSIEYIREDTALGTAGALSLLDSIPNEPIVVSNGDLITTVRFREMLKFHEFCSASATMAVRVHEWQNPFGVVQTEGFKIISYEEKPLIRSHINAGIYVLNPDVLKLLLPNVVCDMPDLFEEVRASGRKTVAYSMYEPWLDVGRPSDLLLAERRFRNESGER